MKWLSLSQAQIAKGGKAVLQPEGWARGAITAMAANPCGALVRELHFFLGQKAMPNSSLLCSCVTVPLAVWTVMFYFKQQTNRQTGIFKVFYLARISASLFDCAITALETTQRLLNFSAEPQLPENQHLLKTFLIQTYHFQSQLKPEILNYFRT